jgi:hypothetical protein
MGLWSDIVGVPMKPTEPAYGLPSLSGWRKGLSDVMTAAQGGPVAAAKYPMSNMAQSTYSGQLPYSAPSFGYGPSIDSGGFEKTSFAAGGGVASTGGYDNPFDDPNFTDNYWRDANGNLHFRDGAVMADDSRMWRGENRSDATYGDDSSRGSDTRQPWINPPNTYHPLPDISPNIVPAVEEYLAGINKFANTPTVYGRNRGGGGGWTTATTTATTGNNTSTKAPEKVVGGAATPVDDTPKERIVLPKPVEPAEKVVGGATTPVDDTEKEKEDPASVISTEVIPGSGTIKGPGGIETLIGGATTAIDDTEKKKDPTSVIGTEVIPGSGTIKGPGGIETLIGGATTAIDDTRTPGGRLVIDTNGVNQTSNNTNSTADTSYTTADTGLSDRELALYGGNNDRTDTGGYAGWEQDLYGTGVNSYLPYDDTQGTGLTEYEQALYGGMSPNVSSATTSTKESKTPVKTGLGSLVDKFANKAVDKLHYANENRAETAGNIAGAIVGGLTGTPGLNYAGTAVKELYNAGKDYLRGDSGTGLTKEEQALYDQIGVTQTPTPDIPEVQVSATTNTVRDPNWQFSGFTGYESPGLSSSQMGIGDMNVLNFMTGGWNIGGSPTSMIDPASMANYVSASEHGDTYAPGQTFASMNTELADYAKSHPVSTGNQFAENTAQYFRDHPEINPATGYLWDDRARTPEEEAAAKAKAAEYDTLKAKYAAEYPDQTSQGNSAETQQQLDEYYKQLYGDVPMAAGGLASLPEYKAGGLLHGPGDGVSDSIPAVIKGATPQRAALADGEFVIPARIVSELGNGSTKAGSARLYEMMDRVQKRRGATVGKNKTAVNSKAYEELHKL